MVYGLGLLEDQLRPADTGGRVRSADDEREGVSACGLARGPDREELAPLNHRVDEELTRAASGAGRAFRRGCR